jgi:hypothetical protein
MSDFSTTPAGTTSTAPATSSTPAPSRSVTSVGTAAPPRSLSAT